MTFETELFRVEFRICPRSRYMDINNSNHIIPFSDLHHVSLFDMAAQEAAELTHDELWDDSALVNSWDEAFAEYKVSLDRQEQSSTC